MYRLPGYAKLAGHKRQRTSINGFDSTLLDFAVIKEFYCGFHGAIVYLWLTTKGNLSQYGLFVKSKRQKITIMGSKVTNEEAWRQLQAAKEVLRRVFGSVNNAAKGLEWPQKTLDRLFKVSQDDMTEVVRRNISALVTDIIRTIDIVPVSDDESGPHNPPIPKDLLDQMLGFSFIGALREHYGRDKKEDDSTERASGDLEPHPLGNAGIIFIDADTGKEFFVVEFPPYLRVINPYEVVLRPRRVRGGTEPDIHDLEDESIEEPS